MVKEEDWIEKLSKGGEFKDKFIEGLNKLGFPLEFRIRKKLKDKGFQNVQEGNFCQNIEGENVTKSFDIYGTKSKKAVLKNNITVHMDIQLIGDCKSSIDPKKFLFLVPESSNLGNKILVGPILSNLQTANVPAYRNQEVASQFIGKYGSIYLASNVNDTSKELITGGETQNAKKTPKYETIYDISEKTIIPALYSKFLFWRNASINDYKSIDAGNEIRLKLAHYNDIVHNHYFSFKLLVPLIVTTKPILVPEVKDGEVKDIKLINFFLYEHSVMNPDKYFELIYNAYDVGIFICNEDGFDSLMDYIDAMADSVFKVVTDHMDRHTDWFFRESQEVEQFNKEIKSRKELIL